MRRRRRALSSTSGVAALGDVGDGEQRRHAQTSSSPSRTTASPSISTVGSSTTQSRWTGTWTVPPIAAEAPKATWAVPRIFSSSRMLPVRIASSLVPIPSSATLVPSSPWAVSSSSRASPPAPGRVGQVARRGRSARPAPRPGRRRRSSRRRRACPRRVPSSGAMKPSPQGRLPKAPRALRSPASTIEVRPSSPRRRSLPLAQVIRASEPASSSAQIASPRRRSSLHLGAHHPGQHLLGDAGHRRDPGAGLARGLAGGGVGERLDRRRDHHVGGEHRRGDRRRRLGGVRLALRHHRQGRVGALALGDAADQRPERLGGRIADHQHRPRPGATARHSRTTTPDRSVQLLGHAAKAITIPVPAGVAQLVRAAES